MSGRGKSRFGVVASCLVLLLLGCGGEGVTGDGEFASTEEALCASPKLERVALSTGVSLSYLVQGSRHGEPVIFIHGYTDSHRSFDSNLPRFPRSFRSYALDLRGHGDSDKPVCCYEQGDFADDVVAFMDALGIERASLVGHSMGSFVAHRVAVEHPDRVDALVLIGSAPTVAGNAVALDFKTVVDTLVDPIDPEFVLSFQSSTFFRPIPEEFLATSVAESLKVPASVWQQALDGLLADDHSAALPNIVAPTLILFGDQDVFFTALDQAALDAAIPNSTLVTYPDTGHGTHVELPGPVTREIARFLR
jgi:non-heme chloroperoxidase